MDRGSGYLPEINPATGEAMIRFGDWLVRRGLICREELDAALAMAMTSGCRVGDALVLMELIDRSCIEQEADSHNIFTAFHRPSHLTAVLFDDF